MLLLKKPVRRAVTYGLFVAILLFTIAPLKALKVSAATDAQWVDAATITYNGRTFKDTNINDSDWHFIEQSPANGCTSYPAEINGFKYNTADGGFNQQDVTLHDRNPIQGGHCTDGTVTKITLDAQPDGYNVAFQWVDGSNIQSADGRKKFSSSDGITFTSVNDQSSCKDFITVGSVKSDLTLQVLADPQGGAFSASGSGVAGKYSNQSNSLSSPVSGYPFYKTLTSGSYTQAVGSGVKCTFAQIVHTTAGNPAKAGDKGVAVTGDGSDSSAPSCESQGFSLTNLSWIICPIINGLAGAADAMYQNIVTPMLQTPRIQIANDDPIFKAWSSLRILGNIVLVIAMLILVFGQAIGGGMVDAYTAKKLLPRVLLAAILINISIYLVAILVDLTGIFGHGLVSLLNGLVPGAKLTLNAGTSQVLAVTGAGGFLATVGAGGAIWVALKAALSGGSSVVGPAVGSMVQMFLLFVLLPAFLTFLAIVITLILRQGLITALIIVSPIAFALYCLPSGEKYFKKWWDLLFKALLIYPIIALIFGVANILSYTTNQVAGSGANSTGLGPIVGQLTSILILFVPLLMIPFAFKLAGGAIGSLYGTFTGLNKKAVEGIKGNAADPNSLRRRLSARNRSNINDARGNAMTNMRNRAGFTSTRRGRAAARLIGGGPRLLEQQAARNAERGQFMHTTWSDGDDNYARGSTIAPSNLQKWKQAYLADPTSPGARYRPAGIDELGRERGEQWLSADRKWVSELSIRGGNRAYASKADRQANFRELFIKTAALPKSDQDRVKEDFRDYAKESHLEMGTANGSWQGVSIPMSQLRIDARRQKLVGKSGELEWGAPDDTGMLLEAGARKGQEWVGQAGGGFQEVTDAALRVTAPEAPSSPDFALRAEKAVSYYHGLDQYINGVTPDGANLYAAAQAAAAAAGEGATAGEPGMMAGYTTSQGAAWQDAQMAKTQLDRMKSSPEFQAFLRANDPSYKAPAAPRPRGSAPDHREPKGYL